MFNIEMWKEGHVVKIHLHVSDYYFIIFIFLVSFSDIKRLTSIFMPKEKLCGPQTQTFF